MKRQKIKNIVLSGKNGDSVRLCGWVKSKRVSKAFAFVVLNDGSQQADMQVVVDAGTPAYDTLSDCHTGAAVGVLGELRESPGKGQKWEVLAKEFQIYGQADPQVYPLQKKGHSLEFLREIGHLRGRTNTFGAVFRTRNVLSQLVHEFFQEQGFIWAHTPIITANDCEGAGELFAVSTLNPDNMPRNDKGHIDYSKDFFGKPAHLTVSGQLEGEIMAMSFSDIYTFGPTFRAENSNTTRHLSEFWMIEPEMAFADLHDDAQLAEDFLRFMFRHVVGRCPDELKFLGQFYKNTSIDMLQQLAESSFVKMSYTDAIKTLKEAPVKFEYPVEWGVDLQSEHERYLTDEVIKGPVIVHDYPKDIKAFYMRANDDGKTVAAMDVLVPRIGEIIGGSQREERLDHLVAKMTEMDIPRAELEWYLDLRRFGSCPHAGFGLGFERLVQYVTGMTNIRDVIPFPRAPHLIDF